MTRLRVAGLGLADRLRRSTVGRSLLMLLSAFRIASLGLYWRNRILLLLCWTLSLLALFLRLWFNRVIGLWLRVSNAWWGRE